MMVLERWTVAAIVALSLAPMAFGQTTPPPVGHHARAKAKTSSNPNPAQAAPEQAIAPDASTPLAETPNYDPPPPPPRPPDPDPPAQPPQAAAPATPTVQSVVEKTEAPAPPPAPLRPMTPEEMQLEKDSTRLLALVRELKEEVSKAGMDTLSLTALRKAEEIERLTRSLKERLKSQAVTGSAAMPRGAQ